MKTDLARQREVVDGFLAALRGGDFEGLLTVLDPDLVVRTDLAAAPGAPAEIRGAAVWAKQAGRLWAFRNATARWFAHGQGFWS